MKEGKIENKKNDKSLLIAFVLSILIILSLVTYILYDKGVILSNNEKETVEKNNINKEETKNAEEVVDINSDLIQKLYSIFRLDNSCYMSVEALNNSNLVKLRMAYNNIPIQNYESISCSKLTLTESGYCGTMNGLMQEAYNSGNMTKFKEYEKQNITDIISTKTIEIKLRELFGSDYEIKHESFGIGHVATPGCHEMRYEANSNLYAEFHCEGGGTCGGYSQELVSASKKNNELYIETTLKDPNEKQTKVTYKFKKDKINDNYVFVNVVEK